MVELFIYGSELSGLLGGDNDGELRTQNHHVMGILSVYLFICRCLPPDTTWHMVKSPKAD